MSSWAPRLEVDPASVPSVCLALLEEPGISETQPVNMRRMDWRTEPVGSALIKCGHHWGSNTPAEEKNFSRPVLSEMFASKKKYFVTVEGLDCPSLASWVQQSMEKTGSSSGYLNWIECIRPTCEWQISLFMPVVFLFVASREAENFQWFACLCRVLRRSHVAAVIEVRPKVLDSSIKLRTFAQAKCHMLRCDAILAQN